MAKQPPSASKTKDDDSWGKLASDLLGIQFGGADDDFDLPDDEPPTAKSIPAEVSPSPEAISGSKARVAEQASEPDLSFPEEDLSFPEDTPVTEKKAVAPERREVAAERDADPTAGPEVRVERAVEPQAQEGRILVRHDPGDLGGRVAGHDDPVVGGDGDRLREVVEVADRAHDPAIGAEGGVGEARLSRGRGDLQEQVPGDHREGAKQLAKRIPHAL